MEHPNEFQKLLRQIMPQEPKPILSEEEIHFDELAMGVMELVVEYMFKVKAMNIFKTAVILLCSLTLLGCSTGSFIVTGNVRPATDPNVVKLYLEPPAEYETIGIVEASSDVEISSQAATNRAIQELKKQAAKIGANGVLITNADSESGDVVGYYSGGVFYGDASEVKKVKGRAIFVIRE